MIEMFLFADRHDEGAWHMHGMMLTDDEEQAREVLTH